MAQGLRPHYHQYYLYDMKKYFNHNKQCMIKKVSYRCMICGDMRYEIYECYEPPPKEKDKSRVLQKNKRKYSNHR